MTPLLPNCTLLADGLLASVAPAALALTTFGAVGLAVFGVAQVFAGKGDKHLRDRLRKADHNKADANAIDKAKAEKSPIGDLLRALAKPFMKDGKSLDLRGKLIKGGVYSPTAVQVMTGFKIGLGLLGGFFGFLLGTLLLGDLAMGVLVGIAAGLLGFFLPVIWLSQKIKSNQKELEQGLPDALDLMVVCVEAGLTVDAAMQRVGEELGGTHAAIAREFGIAHMETRIGLSRTEAFKNLGRRTGNLALQSFAAMLAQAERFGTSIAQALHVQADGLRQDRSLKAEEKAAKNMVKLNIPLVLFIFPGTLIVLMGPIVIKFAFTNTGI